MEIVVYIIGGLLAGIATGLVGLSAATIIAPLFATVLGMDTFTAIGIALASDVFASATSASTFIKNKHINIKKALYLGITVIIFTIIASILSYNANRYTLNSAINIFVFVLGIRFIVYPVTSNKKPSVMKTGKWLVMQSIIWGAVIGSISGYFGSGGGLSMLAVLTMLLGYNLKDGIGTSVFIMAFAALVGAIAHFMRSGVDINPLVITCIAAFIGANIASRYANKVNEITLNRVVGGFLIIYGIGLILVHYLT